MSGETEANVSGWTVDTLRVHILALMEAADKRYEQRFEAQEQATLYARQVTNEFRGTLSDQASLFMPRAEAIQRADNNSEKIDLLRKDLTAIDKKFSESTGASRGSREVVAFIFAAVAAVTAIIAFLI